MSTLTDARMPRMSDKLAAQEAALKVEAEAVNEEIIAVKKAKKRAIKKN